MEKIWADWEVVKLLGEGSFGKVYEVVRNRFGIEERSAVKVITIPSTPSEANSLRSEGMTDGDITAYYKGLVQDFVQEIALMSQLRGHSNIVGYEDYEVIEHTDRFGWDIYIRMELLTPLTSRMENGVMAMTEQEAVRMAIDISTALEECYDKRIVHRDIKPDNIFIGKNGEYKLGDFGVARTVEKTISGLSKKGTYTYMAPEIYKGEPGGMNSDVYSLGMVLYRVLNDGREPFTPYAPAPIGYEDKQKALARRMNGEAFPQPRCASAEVTQIINKACAYHPAARYQTPTQLKNDLIARVRAMVAAVNAPAPAAVPPMAVEATVAAVRTAPAVQPGVQTQPVYAGSPSPAVIKPPAPAPVDAPKKKKSPVGLIIAIIVAALLLLVGAVIGVVFLIGELTDSGSSHRRGGDDDDDETVTTTTTVAEYPELNHPKTAEEAVDSFFAVHYDMSEETILFAMPDEMAAYYEETYGIKVDDEFLAEARNQSASDPSKRVTAEYGELTRVATATGVDRVPLAEMGIVMDDVVWYKQQASITHSDGDVTQNDYYVMYYHGHYYSFSAIGFLNTTAKAVAANREKATCGECGVEGKIGEDIIFYNDVGEALCEDCYEDWQQSQQAAAIIGTWGCYIDGELMFGETCKGEKVWMTMTYKENGMYQQRFDPEDLLRCSAKANGYYTVDAYLSVAGVTYDEAVSKMDELNPSDLAYTFDGKKLVMNGYNETFTLNGDTLTLYESTTFVMTRQ